MCYLSIRSKRTFYLYYPFHGLFTLKKGVLMNIAPQAKTTFSTLLENDFLATHGFEIFRFDELGFSALASTLISKTGKEITVAFNIHDDEPNQVELVIQIMNTCSLAQIKIIGQKIGQETTRDIDIYKDPKCISMVSYYELDELSSALEMMECSLLQLNSVAICIVEM